MEEELRALLLAGAGVNALLADRINWGLRPQGDGFPASTLTTVSGVTDYHLAGPSGFIEPRVQLDIWAKSYTSAIAVKRALIGAINDVPYGGIQGIFIDAVRDLTVMTPPDTVFQISLDLMVKATES